MWNTKVKQCRRKNFFLFIVRCYSKTKNRKVFKKFFEKKKKKEKEKKMTKPKKAKKQKKQKKTKQNKTKKQDKRKTWWRKMFLIWIQNPKN